MPAYNEERVVANCVDSILATGRAGMELILVDDGSADRTLQILRGYEHLPEVRVLTQANAGKAAALNAGIACAGGEVLILVDADGIFTEATIPELLAAF